MFLNDVSELTAARFAPVNYNDPSALIGKQQGFSILLDFLEFFRAVLGIDEKIM